MNRLKLYLAEEEAPEPEEEYGDFVVISGTFGYVSVTHETAEHVERLLDRRCVPEWVVFHDRSGSRLRVRTEHIRSFGESTREQRAADRRYERARRREERQDKSWEDDD